MKKRFIFVVLALFIATGAGVFWLLNREQEPRLDVISRKDALEDYDYLWETLEENYPFFGVAERKYGLDIQQLKQEYRQQLEGMGEEIDFLEFYHLMEECVGQFRQLGHLIVYSPGAYWTEVGDAEHLLGDINNNFFTTLLNYRYQNFYDLTEVRERYEFLDEKLDTSEKETPSKVESNLILERMSDKIAYMKIKSFAGENLGEKPKQEIDDFLLDNADTPYLIIDVCGNGGGYSNYWSDYIVIPNITEEKTAPYFYVTPYGENSRQEMKMNGQEASQMNNQLDALRQLPNINQDDLLNVRYYGKGAYTFQPQLDGKVYEGQIFLLIDRKSSSSADAFAYFCKGSGFATVLGQEDACGSGPGGNFVMDRLPHSNLLFRYRPVLALDMEGTALEEFGVAPDVLLPSRAKNSNDKISSLAACLSYIEKLEENK